MRTLLLLIPALLFVGCNNDVKEPEPVASSAISQTPQEAPVQSLEETVPSQTAAAAGSNVPTSLSGETLYKRKCASCHGLNAEKSALGKSEIIASWPSERIVDAINGYKAGSYGKGMKALMQAQVRELRGEDIDILAHYISAQD